MKYYYQIKDGPVKETDAFYYNLLKGMQANDPAFWEGAKLWQLGGDAYSGKQFFDVDEYAEAEAEVRAIEYEAFVISAVNAVGAILPPEIKAQLTVDLAGNIISYPINQDSE